MTLKTMGSPPTHGIIACGMGPDGSALPLQQAADGTLMTSGNSVGAPDFVSVTALPDRVEISGSATSAAVLSNFPVADTSGARSIAVQVTAIAATSTLVAEESNDGTTWTNLTSVDGVAAITAVGLYGYNFSAKEVRVRQSVYGGSGTSSVVAELRAAAIPATDINKIAGKAVAATGANVPPGTLPVQDADGYSPGAQSVTSATTIFSLDTQGFASTVVQIISAGTGCSTTFEGSNDNVNWGSTVGNLLSGAGTSAATPTFGSNFGLVAYAIPALYRYVRARCTVYGSGTVTLVPTLRKNPSNQAVSISANITSIGSPVALPPPADTILRASAAATATFTSADQTNSGGARGISVVLDITAVTTGTATLEIDYKDPASGKYIALLTGAALAGTGTTRYVVYPGGGAVAANLSVNDSIGRVFRVTVTKSDGSSWTFSVGYTLLA